MSVSSFMFLDDSTNTNQSVQSKHPCRGVVTPNLYVVFPHHLAPQHKLAGDAPCCGQRIRGRGLPQMFAHLLWNHNIDPDFY